MKNTFYLFILLLYSTINGQISANDSQIKDVADPTDPQDGTTKNYVDELISNLQQQISVLKGELVIDNEGNIYNSVKIGDQLWTTENAENITYRDGTPIPQVTNATEWENLNTGAWCYYDNDSSKGKLYNWFAVAGIYDEASYNNPSLRKKFAPQGWKVPNSDNFSSLVDYLITNGYDHPEDFNGSENLQGLESLDRAILEYFRDGESGTDEFGLKAIDIGMDLKGNDMDMSIATTWFALYQNYDNVTVSSNDNYFLWEFFYKVINQANGIINTIPDDAAAESLVYKNKSYAYRGIAYFYLIRLYQHTKSSDGVEAFPIDFGDIVGQPNPIVGQVKTQILSDLTKAYNGLSDYARSSVEEVDASVVAAYLARYYLTYEDWANAEKYAKEAADAGTISADVSHGYQSLDLSEVIWGAQVNDTTSEVYGSFFSHMSQINDGYSGWNHEKSINSLLYDQIPSTDKRKAWFAGQYYGAGEVIVPGTWGHYVGTSKYTALKFYCFSTTGGNGAGTFVGDYIYLRNTEFILTEAEALARQGNDAAAADALYELNSVRDPSYVKSTKTGQDLIDEILLYRRIELWGDGVSFFDMARLGVGLNRNDGRVNRVQAGEGGTLVIPALDAKMIYQIPFRWYNSLNRLAKPLASKSDWIINTGDGFPGNDQSSNNSSGLNILPIGYSDIEWNFTGQGSEAPLWTLTEKPDSNSAYYTNLNNFSHSLKIFNVSKNLGFSVRFIRD